MTYQVECPDCDGEGRGERIKNWGNAGWYAAREARTGDPGPCYEEYECETCGGEGVVDHECDECGKTHEDAPCEICGGCEHCCSCTVCDVCGEKVEDGGGAVKWDGQDWCPKCMEAHGTWCQENDRPCSECIVEDCNEACEHRAAKLASEDK